MQDDDPAVAYAPSNVWRTESFEFWELPHAGMSNGTWHQINAGRAGSVSLDVGRGRGAFFLSCLVLLGC